MSTMHQDDASGSHSPDRHDSSRGREIRRPARSKNGCLTCRRRKVRCDEVRPHCGHCQRLKLSCQWRPAPTARTASVRSQSILPSNGSVADAARSDPADQAALVHQAAGIDQFFDYATFLWADGALLGHSELEISDVDRMSLSGHHHDHSISAVPLSAVAAVGDPLSATPSKRLLLADTPSSQALSTDGPMFQGEDGELLRYFVNSVVPPLLEVETQQKWSAMRRVLLSTAAASSMVRSAILAFANLLRCRRETPWMQASPRHYQAASAELATDVDDSPRDLAEYSPARRNLLATLFFLCYIEILEERMDATHASLKRAYDVFKQGQRRGFHPVEMQLLSWIRLLDARAVSAGGEGLFLTDKDEELLVQPSPGTLNEEEAETPHDAAAPPERDIDHVLLELLHQPGNVFHQKVQSFMGRISKIDPWHRNRGTVDDETEVMNMAADILRDLRALYDSRPPLMDHAVAGNLRPPHVGRALAAAVTRSFRAYLANFHACKVHLHRVAYKHLPLTAETTAALGQIRHLAQMMVDDGDGADHPLPVSLLWPLLMLGSEEKDQMERIWIRDHIIGMEKVASNARATAQVLEEVQRRQDASGVRQDIRSIMQSVFSRIWAIV